VERPIEIDTYSQNFPKYRLQLTQISWQIRRFHREYSPAKRTGNRQGQRVFISSIDVYYLEDQWLSKFVEYYFRYLVFTKHLFHRLRTKAGSESYISGTPACPLHFTKQVLRAVKPTFFELRRACLH